MNKHHEEHKAHHVTPIKIYIKTFSALIVLTIITVVTSYFDFGIMNLAIALVIASTKAILVILFFMQLKYDDFGNKVTFYSSFLFLSIFLGLTSADVFFRDEVSPLKVSASTVAEGETDPHKLHGATAALVAEGKALFAVQCTSCHGVTGMGDGMAAAALNPKPRNFKSGYWRYGGAPSIIFRTISQGSPGTAMAAFTTLSIEQRYALAHYVHSIATPTPADDKPADLEEAIKLVGNGSKGPQEIPIDMAMEKMEVPDQVMLPASEKNMTHPGAWLFKNQCSQCHGTAGQGAAVSSMGVNPVTVLMTKSFATMRNASWAQSEGEFMKTVSQGMPGRGMPGMSGYSSQEWSALYGYVKSLVQ